MRCRLVGADRAAAGQHDITSACRWRWPSSPAPPAARADPGSVRSPPWKPGMFTPRISSPSSSELRPTKATADVGVLHERLGLRQRGGGRRNPAELEVPPAPGCRYSSAAAYARPPSSGDLASVAGGRRRGPRRRHAWRSAPKHELLVVEEQARVPVRFHMPCGRSGRTRRWPAASAWRSSGWSTSRGRRRPARRGLPCPVEVGPRLVLRRARAPCSSGLAKYSASMPCPLPVGAAQEGRRAPAPACWPCRSRRARSARARPGTGARSPRAASPAATRCRCSCRAERRDRRPTGR